MSVDDAYALETTLQRLRQRYALYVHMPEGTKSGEERSIEVDLADSARRRYSDAEVRYRRVYLAPSGSPDNAGPIMVTRAPATIPSGRNSSERNPPVPIADTDRPTPRRRVAVDEPEGGPRVNLPGTTDSSASTAAAAPTDPPAKTEAAAKTEPAPEPKRGWRRVTDPPPPNPDKPPDKPPQP